MPFTKSIAKAWGDLFGSDLFSDFDSSIRNKTSRLLYDIEVSAPAELRDRAKEQGVLCLEAVNGAMREIMSSLEDTVKNRQRSISYSMEPYLRKELKGAYMKTLGFRGQGCVEEQKVGVSTLYFLHRVRQVYDNVGRATSSATFARTSKGFSNVETLQSLAGWTRLHLMLAESSGLV
jgi:hypothetical protein